MTFSSKAFSNGDLVQILSNATEAEHPTIALAESARQAFRLLEPWCQARAATSSSHPEVKEIITRIKALAILYFQAIDMSIKASQDGINFAQDVQTLCDELPCDGPADVVIEFIVDMQQVAQKSHRHAEATLKQFRSVRSGLFEIIATIPHTTAGVLKDGRKAHKSRVRYERSRAVADAIAKSASDSQITGVIASVLGGVAGPALLVLPALLPIAAFGAEEVGQRCARKAEARKLEEASCKDALTQLERISRDLDKIVNQLGGLARWWSNIVVMLKSLEASACSLRSSNLDTRPSSRIAAISRKWSGIAGQYREYVLQMCKLQDLYPALSDSHIVDLPIRLTIASLAGQVMKCQHAVLSLHNAAQYVPLQHSVQLQRCLNQLNDKLKLKWTSLLDHLNNALAFTIDDLEEFWEDREVVVRTLKETSQVVVDQHARIRDAFTSQRDVISTLLKSSWSSSKRRKLQSTANHVLASEDERLVAFVASGLDSAHADGQVALRALEEALEELGISLGQLESFWKFRSSEGGLDREGLSSAIDSVSLSIDCLPRELVIDRGHFTIRKWLTSNRRTIVMV